MAKKIKGKTFSIRFTVLSVFIIVSLSTATLTLGLQYYFSRNLAKTAAENSFRTTSDKVSERVQALDRRSANLVEVLGHFHELETFPGPEQERRILPLLRRAMKNNPSLYAIYIGYDTGDFFEMINLESGTVRKTFGADPVDRWVIIRISTFKGIRKKTTAYLDSSFKVRIEKQTVATYDPRKRTWYKMAQTSQVVVKTEPYIFATIKAPGVTYAKSINSGQRTIALDISLEGLSGFLQKQQFLPNSRALIFDKKGDILAQASKEEDLPEQVGMGATTLTQDETALIATHPAIQASNEMDVASTILKRQLLPLAKTAGPQGSLKIITNKDLEYFAYVAKIKSDYSSGEFIGVFVPIEDTLRPYMKMIRLSLMITIVLLLFLIPMVLYFTSLIVKPINALSLESQKVKQRRYEDVHMVQSNITEILALSVSMVSMASSIKAHEESLKELIDSFIKLIATAIDHKSPYTGGHCARVPELALMLAKAANGCTQGPLANFSFKTDEQWREFRTAAWLHDCGKVTTPEYIVDKATKLDTIHNRIHEVRMRFEVLLRDARIEYWKGVANGEEKIILRQDLTTKQREIEDDFAFIAESNLGGEFMGEDRIARVKKIAQKTWERHLNDRLGLGHIELSRYPKEMPVLPCRESLLADQPEHIIKRRKNGPLGSLDSQFAMEMPKHLYNLGEIYNLCISRGTLTAEDRYTINEHITTTIRMLEVLPFPENMARIPEYAGSHHETLIGTGYPRKLSAKDIGIPGRILAVADIFEALTASDRPYKKAKKLSEALKILSFMVKDKHLDADLFRLFLETGIYMDYAKCFLEPSQIDDPDISEYISVLNAP